MNGCLNVIWHFPFLGFLFALVYAFFGAILCCTVVLYPVGLGFFQFAQFLLSPFSSALVSRKDLALVRPGERSAAAETYSLLIRIVYFPFGLIAAFFALFIIAGEFLSIIGIPCGIVWAKALPTIFNPVDKICVPKAVADEIERIKAGNTVAKYRGETGSVPNKPEPDNSRNFSNVQVSPQPEVRQYDDARLAEILANTSMYKADLVEKCRQEQEIRSKSREFISTVGAYDNEKLREILSKPELYADELIYACQQEMTERQRLWREQQEREEEQARIERAKQAKAEAEQRAAAWKKSRPYVFAGIALLVLAGLGAGYYSHHREQIRLEQERLEMEDQRALEAELAKRRRIAEQKQAEEQRLEAEKQQQQESIRQAELAKLDSDVNYRLSKGIYRAGDYNSDAGGIVFMVDKSGKHGKALSMREEKMSWLDATAQYPKGGLWTLPSVNELKSIYRNREKLNAGFSEYGGDQLKTEYGSFYWSNEAYASASAWNISMYDEAQNSHYRDRVFYVRVIATF